MAPKKIKSAETKKSTEKGMTEKKLEVTLDNWRPVLEITTICDDEWSCHVNLFAASAGVDATYLESFTEEAENEARAIIKYISLSETMLMVKQIGSAKEITIGKKVFEEAMKIWKNSNELPTDMIALLIKSQIIKLKNDDLSIRKQKKELIEGLKREELLMMSPVPIKVPPTENISKKYLTNIRIRGEEWRDKIYIEDYPIDGPSIYIALTGFYDANLLPELLRIGVPLTSVIKVNVSVYASLGDNLIAEKVNSRRHLSNNILIEKFWKEVIILRSNSRTNNYFKKICFVDFLPPYKKKEGYLHNDDKNAICDDISFLMYDIQDLKRQHRYYLECMHVINLTEKNPMGYIDTIAIYHDKINKIPLEGCSVTVIINFLIESVSEKLESEEDEQKTFDQKKTIVIKSERDQILRIIKDRFQKNILKHSQIKPCDIKRPSHENATLVIESGDKIREKLHHIRQINFSAINEQMLRHMPLPKLWAYHPVQSEAEICYYDQTLEDLAAYLPYKENSESFEKIFIILWCRRMCCSINEFKGASCEIICSYNKQYLNRSPSAIPLKIISVPKSKSFTCSQSQIITTIVNEGNRSSMYEVRNLGRLENEDFTNLIRLIDVIPEKRDVSRKSTFNVNTFHELSAPVFLQVLDNCYNNFNCVKVKYSSLIDSIILAFHNQQNENRMFNCDWQHSILTPICLRDFFEYILDDDYDWIKSEEILYDQRMENYLSQHTLNESQLYFPIIIDNTHTLERSVNPITELEFLLENSIKHDLLVQEIQKNRKTNTTETSEKSAKSPSAKRLTHKKHSKSSKGKDKKKEIDKDKITVANTPSISSKRRMTLPEFRAYHCSGYNLADTRVSMSGKTTTYFLRDGNKINIMTTNNSLDHKEYLALQINVNKHDILIHKPSNTITPIQSLKHFRISSKEGIQFLFTENSPSSKTPNYNLKVSWPSGLQIESVRNDNEYFPYYVRQSYVDDIEPNKEEKYRCYTRKGDIFRFLTNGQVEVLTSDAVIYRCINFAYVEPVIEEIKDKKMSKVKESTKPDKFIKIEVNGFEEILPNGEKTVIQNGIEISERIRLFTRTVSNYQKGEISTRRLDDTEIILNVDGYMSTTFPDGSLITTHYVIEDKEEFVEWTNEEINKFFISSKSNEELLLTQTFDYDNFQLQPSESFLLINIVFVMEHPDYCRITQDNNIPNGVMTLNMPNEVSITISPEGNYLVELDKTTLINISGNNITVENNYCDSETCSASTLCSINLEHQLTIDVLSNDTYCEVSENGLRTYDIFPDGSFKASLGTFKLNDMQFSDAQVCNEDDERTMKVENLISDDNIIKESGYSISTKTTTSEKTINSEGDRNNEVSQNENMSNNHINATNVASTAETKKEKRTISKECKHATANNDKRRYFIMKRDLRAIEMLSDEIVKDCKQLDWIRPKYHMEVSSSKYSDYIRMRYFALVQPSFFDRSSAWKMPILSYKKPMALTSIGEPKLKVEDCYKWMRPFADPDFAKIIAKALTCTLRILQTVRLADHKDCAYMAADAIMKYRRDAVKKHTSRPTTTPRPRSAISGYALKSSAEEINLFATMSIQRALGTMETYHSAEVPSVFGRTTSDKNLMHYLRLDKLELDLAEYHKGLLRSGYMPPYFESIEGSLWLRLCQAADSAVNVAEGLFSSESYTNDKTRYKKFVESGSGNVKNIENDSMTTRGSSCEISIVHISAGSKGAESLRFEPSEP